MATTFKFGNGNWAVKDGYALAYNDENNNFKPLPFDFTRASTATRVNKQGLIETVGSGKPRIDFTDNTSGHLLLEPSRTNFLTYSTLDFNGGSIPTGWTVGFGTGTFSHTETTYKGQGAVKHTQSTTGRSYLAETISLSASTTYTLRVEFDRNNSSGIDDTDYIVATVNMDNFFSKQWSDVDDDGILEVQFITGTDATGELRLGFGVSGNEDGGKTIVFSMPQIEEGSYPTSYIPTEGSSVTRVADDADNSSTEVLTLSNSASFYWNVKGQTEGNSLNNTGYVIAFGTNSSTDSFSYFGLNSTATNWRIRLQDGSSSNFKTLSVSKFDDVKVVVTANTSTYSIYANGAAVFTNQSYNGTAPTIETIKVFVLMNNENKGVIRVVDLKAYNTELTATDAINLTS